MLEIRAAVVYEYNNPLTLDTVNLADPKAGEVLVKIAATGVCGTDRHTQEGDMPAFGVPIVPGHEAAGIVESVGAGVTEVTKGDHVLINMFPGCGKCAPCASGRNSACANSRPGFLLDGTSRISRDGRVIHHFSNVSSFAEYAVVPERGAIRVRRDVGLDKVCLVGCGISTAMGAVINRAKVPIGSSVVIVGCGGVGLNVVQMCALARAGRIIAVDVLDFKLQKAEQFGATHLVNASKVDPVEEVRNLTGGRGADYGFEVISTVKTIRQTFDATAPGGHMVVVGIAPRGSEVSFPAGLGKTVSSGGFIDANPWVDFPKIVDLYVDGTLKIDELITRQRPLEEANEAVEAMKSGEVTRTVLVPGS